MHSFQSFSFLSRNINFSAESVVQNFRCKTDQPWPEHRNDYLEKSDVRPGAQNFDSVKWSGSILETFSRFIENF